MMKKKEVKKKQKELPICTKCIKEVKPTSLQWVNVKDEYNAEYMIPICDDCLEKNKKEYLERYEIFEVVKPYQKKREYKKKTKSA
jgi:hypothetical protein